MIGRGIFAVALSGLAASVASAATTYMNVGTLGNYGWNTVVIPDSSGRGSVTDRVQNGSNGLQFTNGNKELTSGTWAAISTPAFDGVRADAISALNIRVFGTEGDGSDWQPPAFMFAFKRSDTSLSNRYAWWIPWADGTPRAPGSWQEYNALTDGQWFIPNAGGASPHFGRFNSFATMLSYYPDLKFANATEQATIGALPAGAHSFNLGYITSPFSPNVQNYTDSARGTVDWFEVGIGGNITRYDLNDVPEPGTLAALAIGTCLIGIRRRRLTARQ